MFGNFITLFTDYTPEPKTITVNQYAVRVTYSDSDHPGVHIRPGLLSAETMADRMRQIMEHDPGWNHMAAVDIVKRPVTVTLGDWEPLPVPAPVVTDRGVQG